MKNLIIDLCCGIGRFPGDNVVSIDHDRKTKRAIIPLDVRQTLLYVAKT